MPTLLLLRHAKSSWDESWQRDHDRPLAGRGNKAAASIGRFMTAAGYEPQLVISSTAVRAETTARLAAEAGSWTCSIELRSELYGGGIAGVAEILMALSPTVERVLLVGHNPTWQEMVSLFAGGGAFRFPTAALACLRLSRPWAELQAGAAELEWLVNPRLLAGAVE